MTTDGNLHAHGRTEYHRLRGLLTGSLLVFLVSLPMMGLACIYFGDDDRLWVAVPCYAVVLAAFLSCCSMHILKWRLETYLCPQCKKKFGYKSPFVGKETCCDHCEFKMHS